MVDQALSVLEQYELDVKGVRKGRGNWIINCREGDFVLKEYGGGEERAKLQSKMTTQIHEKTGVLVQEIVPNKEGSLLTKDGEENTYTIQTYMEGRECNIKDEKECEAAVQTMARMHRGMIFSETEWGQIPVPYSLKKEFSKRNAELRRLRRYLKEKRKKNDFERFLSNSLPMFFEKALEAEADWEHYESRCLGPQGEYVFCHGDYQHHNVWVNGNERMILQFEKFAPDLPCRDLYLFLRKLMEKYDWDVAVGKSILEVYGKERPIPFGELVSMMYRFVYPEKFWKIANYYFNGKKSFVPEKSMEKLEKLLEQENAKMRFIKEVLAPRF